MGRPDRIRDDRGGIWIWTGVAVGALVYLGLILAWHAGFTAAAPFVAIPAVLMVMIGGGNLLSGRRHGRPAPRFNRPDPVPLARFPGGSGTQEGPPPPAGPVVGSDDTPDPGAVP